MDIDDETNNHEDSYNSKSCESDVEYESQSDDEESKFELKCPECDSSFESKQVFLDHLDSYEGRVTTCTDCRKVFQNSAAFKAHKQLNMCSRTGKVTHYCINLGGLELKIEMKREDEWEWQARASHPIQVLGQNKQTFIIMMHHWSKCCLKGRFPLEVLKSYHLIDENLEWKFKCKLCSKTLHGESQLTAHMRAHKRNRCPTCGQHYARLGQLESHMSKEHGSVKDFYRCHLCERTFVQRRSLVYHYQLSHPGTTIVCPICLELFDTVELLDEHKKGHKLESYTCEKCGQTFSRIQQFLIHLKGHEKYKCENCGEGFASKKAATQHALSQEHRVSGVKTQLQCDQCGEMFPYMRALQEHQTAAHGGNTFFCKKCKIPFKKERHYKNHLQTETHLEGAEPKAILPCKECNKTFKNLNNLRSHVSKMHTNAKELACNLCPYKTKIRNNLKRHMALHTDKPQFVCDKCGVKLQTKSALQEHTNRAHVASKNFSCEKCGALFAKSSDLNRHLVNVHSETSSHTCDCGKGYKSLSNLKRHQMKVHSHAETKIKRLTKLYPVDPKPKNKPKKKKKTSLKKNPKTTATDDLLLAPFDEIVHGISPETDELLQVVSSYNIVEDKNPAVYSQSLDLNQLHEVESMIQLEADPDPMKQGNGVLINIRNLFDSNEFILPHDSQPELLEPHHIMPQNSGLPDFMPHDLNFFNDKVDWDSAHSSVDNQL